VSGQRRHDDDFLDFLVGGTRLFGALRIGPDAVAALDLCGDMLLDEKGREVAGNGQLGLSGVRQKP
jgi:hypothetical protein